jgi:predicted transposase/invertase (TIGR01784 family)
MLLTEWKFEDALRVREMEGIEKGIEKGEKKNSIRVAKNLKSMGMGVEDIAKATGLSVDEILKM